MPDKKDLKIYRAIFKINEKSYRLQIKINNEVQSLIKGKKLKNHELIFQTLS